MRRIERFVHLVDTRYPLEKALLFGSTANGNRLEESDVDVILVSKAFQRMPIPERTAAAQRMWENREELQALCYTPEEFAQVSKRLTMKDILSEAVDVTPTRPASLCPRCGKKGSPHVKVVSNRKGKRYPYLYFAHYVSGRVKWCYVGLPTALFPKFKTGILSKLRSKQRVLR